MLKQRVITAVLLLLVLLPALFMTDPTPFCLLAMLFIAAAVWEWGRLNGLTWSASVVLGGLGAVVCGGFWWRGLLTMPLPQLWLWVGAAWVLLGSWVLRSGVAAWGSLPAFLRLSAGFVALCLTWLAVAQAKVIGINFLLSSLVLVWVADIGAYFAGRAFGGRFTRRKLAPSISPGKSWEGVWGGMVGVMLLAFGWCQIDALMDAKVPSLFTHVGIRGTLLLLAMCVLMASMSVVGDLIESLIKRNAGVKDSSALLPGHGGVLDRVDALLPTLPLAMMLYSF